MNPRNTQTGAGSGDGHEPAPKTRDQLRAERVRLEKELNRVESLLAVLRYQRAITGTDRNDEMLEKMGVERERLEIELERVGGRGWVGGRTPTFPGSGGAAR